MPALEDFDLRPAVRPVLDWYKLNKRDLPWRRETSPYRVWVSEIMLQQTRVESVKPYFDRFLAELPDCGALADCPEEKLLKLWEGLGYYNRVRNMQKAARIIQDSGGEFPRSYEEIRALPGIGSYTAGAIASIAFGEAVPAVDGNVLRVLMRLCADPSDIAKASAKTRAENALRRVMPGDRPGEFNQALMELGAIVCVPNGAPSCACCPWSGLCLARKNKLTQQLPVKAKSKPRRREKRTVLLILSGNEVVLNRRPNHGLLAGLYEFPNRSGYLSEEEVLREIRTMKLAPLHIKKLSDAVHIFSHVEWHMRGYSIQVDELTKENSGLLFAEIPAVQDHYAVPSAFSAYVRELTGN